MLSLIASQKRPHLTSLTALALSVASLLLAGCGGGSNSSSPASQSVTTAAPLSVSAATPSGLTATFAESAAAIPVGGSVTYTLTLTNNTTQPIAILDTLTNMGQGTVPANFEVLNAQSQNVYPGPITSSALPAPPTTVYTVAPGQSLSETQVVSGVFTATGPYSATARFTFQTSSGTTLQTTTVGPLTVTAQ